MVMVLCRAFWWWLNWPLAEFDRAVFPPKEPILRGLYWRGESLEAQEENADLNLVLLKKSLDRSLRVDASTGL